MRGRVGSRVRKTRYKIARMKRKTLTLAGEVSHRRARRTFKKCVWKAGIHTHIHTHAGKECRETSMQAERRNAVMEKGLEAGIVMDVGKQAIRRTDKHSGSQAV